MAQPHFIERGRGRKPCSTSLPTTPLLTKAAKTAWSWRGGTSHLDLRLWPPWTQTPHFVRVLFKMAQKSRACSTVSQATEAGSKRTEGVGGATPWPAHHSSHASRGESGCRQVSLKKMGARGREKGHVLWFIQGCRGAPAAPACVRVTWFWALQTMWLENFRLGREGRQNASREEIQWGKGEMCPERQSWKYK